MDDLKTLKKLAQTITIICFLFIGGGTVMSVISVVYSVKENYAMPFIIVGLIGTLAGEALSITHKALSRLYK